MSDALSTLGFFITLATFITALHFKKRLRIELDKRDLQKNLNRLVKELSGFSSSLTNDMLYNEDFLKRIDSKLDETLSNYDCLSLKVKLHIKYTMYYINFRCIKESQQGNTLHIHKLSKQVQKIAILLRKDCQF